MSATGLAVLDRNVEQTNEWLNEVAEVIGGSKQQAYHVLRGGLHALRDRLTVDEAAHLAAQLPHFVRGIFYEGYKPARMPSGERSREAFLEKLKAEAPEGVPPEKMAEAVFTVLKVQVDPGELAHVREMLPKHVAELMDAS
jgi:uncharacterized protein (DUF2267 family)